MVFKLTTSTWHYVREGKKISDAYPIIPATYPSFLDEMEYDINNRPYKYVGRIVLKNLDELMNLGRILECELVLGPGNKIEIYDNYRECKHDL